MCILRRFRFHSFLNSLPFTLSLAVVFFFFFTAIMNLPAFVLALGLLMVSSFFFRLDYGVIKRAYQENVLIFSAILSAAFSYSFYRRSFESDSIRSLASIVQRLVPLSTETVFQIFSFGGFCLGLFSILYLLCYIIEAYALGQEWQHLKKVLSLNGDGWKTVASLFLTYMLAISALIRSNVDFHDDMQRKFDGEHGFHLFSRHLNSFLSRFLNTDNYLVDLSPLTQILAVALIAAASYIIILVFTKQRKFHLWSIIAVLPLGLSPYFLECLSFKFDSPFMALTVLLNLLPLLFYDRKPGLYILITTLCITCAATSYQACLGIFPAAVIFLVFYRWSQGDSLPKVFQLILRSVLGYLAGVLVYRIFIMRPVDSYVSSEMFSLTEMIPGVIGNIGSYFRFIFNDFDPKWLLCLGILIAFLVVGYAFQTKQKVVSVILGIAAVVLSACISFGIYIVLVEPSFHCRAMYGFGAFMAIAAVMAVNLPRATVAKLSALYLSWCLIVFSFMYGNVLRDQQDYIDFRAEAVLQDLHSLEGFHAETPKQMEIVGTIGMSPILENMPQYGRVLNRMATMTFNQFTSFNCFKFFNYYDMNAVETKGIAQMDLPLLKEGYYHNIYGDGTNYLIELKTY